MTQPSSSTVELIGASGAAKDALPTGASQSSTTVLGKRPREVVNVGDTVTVGDLAIAVGPYVQSAALVVPAQLDHNRRTWAPTAEPWWLWPSRSKTGASFDSFTSTAPEEAGNYFVRCRVCALNGSSAVCFLKRGKTSNAGKNFFFGAARKSYSEKQRRQHGLVDAYLSPATGAGATVAHTAGESSGSMLLFVRRAAAKPMTAAQARPHHLQLTIMLVTTLSPHALVCDPHLGKFLDGLGGPYAPPARHTVTELLLDLHVCVRDRVIQSRGHACGLYQGPPFLHIVTDMWSDSHASGSYRSVVISFLNPDTVEAEEVQLGVSPFVVDDTHDHISSWVTRRLAYFDVKETDTASATTDSGYNVRKAMLASSHPWVPCAAHAVHDAVKAAIVATGRAPLSLAAEDSTPMEALQQVARKQSRSPAERYMVGRVRKLINHFHKSAKSVAALDGLPFPGDEAPRHPLTDCPTRWGSLFNALCRLFSLQPRLEQFAALPELSP